MADVDGDNDGCCCWCLAGNPRAWAVALSTGDNEAFAAFREPFFSVRKSLLIQMVRNNASSERELSMKTTFSADRISGIKVRLPMELLPVYFFVIRIGSQLSTLDKKHRNVVPSTQTKSGEKEYVVNGNVRNRKEKKRQVDLPGTSRVPFSKLAVEE